MTTATEEPAGQPGVAVDFGVSRLGEPTGLAAIDALRVLARASSPPGNTEDFLHTCTAALREAFKADYALIGTFADATRTCVRSRAASGPCGRMSNFTYDLAGSPCEQVVLQEQIFVPCGLQNAFPEDALLVELGLESYFGSDLRDSQGEVFGLVLVMSTRPMARDPWIHPLLGLFADRIALELEHERETRMLGVASLVFSASPHAIAVTDVEGRVLSGNDAFLRLVGLGAAAVQDRPIGELVPGLLPEAAAGDRGFDAIGQRANGLPFPTRCSVVDVPGADGGAAYRVFTFEDLSERHFSECRTLRLAYLDTVTGLPNRQSFEAAVRRALADATAAGHRLALLALDLDGFKAVNDLAGHAAGDRLLARVAAALDGVIGAAGGLLARVGGDEFAMLLEGDDLEQRLGTTVEAVRLAVTGACFLDLPVSASIGVAEFPDDGTTLPALLQVADRALYEAKAGGKDRSVFASRVTGRPPREPRRGERVRVTPRFHLPTGRLSSLAIGVEEGAWGATTAKVGALVHAAGVDAVLPLELLTSWLRDWSPLLPDAARVCLRVDLSGARPTTYLDELSAACAAAGLPMARLSLALDERAILGCPTVVLHRLEAMRSLGVGILLDDFGTGHATPREIRRLPLTGVVLAGCLLDRHHHGGRLSRHDAAVAHLSYAGHLGLEAAARGVTESAQVAQLLGLGCAHAQGPALGAAVEGPAVAGLLRTGWLPTTTVGRAGCTASVAGV